MAENCTINAENHVTTEMTTTIFCSDMYGLQSRSISFLIVLTHFILHSRTTCLDNSALPKLKIECWMIVLLLQNMLLELFFMVQQYN